MNKKVLLGAGACCAAAAGLAAARKGRSGPQQSKWDKMRKGMEEMPPDFPPRVMYDNIEAAKANTEEILTLLRSESGQAKETEAESTT